MSRWFSRLGQLCARRAKTVLALWLAALFAAAGAALAFSEGTTASYSIPDAEYEAVLDELGDEIDASRAAVRWCCSPPRTARTSPRSSVRRWPGSSRRSKRSRRAGGLRPLRPAGGAGAGPEDLEDGLQELEDGRQEVDGGWEELEALSAQLGEDHPMVQETEAELSAAQEDLDESAEELERAERQTELTEGMRTVSPQSGVAMLTLQLSEEAYD